MPASAPGPGDKMFPSATYEDQEKIANMEMTPVYVSTPPFSSPDPRTDGIRMQLVDEADTSAAAAKEAAASSEDKDLKAQDWKDQIEAAEDTESLDALAQRYEASGADFSTVQAAFDKKYEDLSDES